MRTKLASVVVSVVVVMALVQDAGLAAAQDALNLVGVEPRPSVSQPSGAAPQGPAARPGDLMALLEEVSVSSRPPAAQTSAPSVDVDELSYSINLNTHLDLAELGEGWPISVAFTDGDGRSWDAYPGDHAPGFGVNVKTPLRWPAPAANPKPTDPRRSFARLSARASANRVPRDCYRTSVKLAGANGGSTDGVHWPEARGYRGRSLATGLREAIEAGTLKPGMVVYCNLRPGTDPMSVNLDNLPHWATYLGKDSQGVDRFADNWATDFTIEGFAAEYRPRVIDFFCDPYK